MREARRKTAGRGVSHPIMCVPNGAKGVRRAGAFNGSGEVQRKLKKRGKREEGAGLSMRAKSYRVVESLKFPASEKQELSLKTT